MKISFDNTFAQLSAAFYAETEPTRVKAPRLIAWNEDLATELGINDDGATDAEKAAFFSGNTIPEGAQPIAQAYAGHQFGGFSPQLGDGRAVLLGEVVSARGERFDIQLKGAGATLFSRRGDGRSALGPVLREYLLSEAMHTLGVPTTRALACLETGEKVARESMEPGGVFTRVASSHLRIGTFQYFAARGDDALVEELLRYAAGRHMPELREDDCLAESFLKEVARRQARLIAGWMSLGFIHGVMNTDNVSIAGETIDYGPCAFMDSYRSDQVFSYIDQQGRYAFRNQPAIGFWNLLRLAECLLPLLDNDETKAVEKAESIREIYASCYDKAYHSRMAAKLGFSAATEETTKLSANLLEIMEENYLDFTRTFASLAHGRLDVEGEFATLTDWQKDWRDLQQNAGMETSEAGTLMRGANPVLIPRNHLVHQAIEQAYEGDYTRFHELRRAWADPYGESWLESEFAQSPEPHQRVVNTFCGT